jgi:hypothetical protein
MQKLSIGLPLALAVLLTGCAFDVIHIEQSPAQYEAVTATNQVWVLQDDLKVPLVMGWSTALKKGSTWRQVGRIKEGDVIRTRDQVVTVEASNIYEANPVIDHGNVVGFYLVVENTFTPADPPKPINLLPKNQ